MKRRRFLQAAGLSVTGALAVPALAASRFSGERLQVWSCGGLAEAFLPANEAFEAATGGHVDYTGAFAAALGKSLLGSARTEVFAPRVLALARKLREEGKMLHFSPLCFTRYVLITPRGNPAGITGIEDLAREGVRVVLSPGASPPGGGATLAILEAAGVLEAARRNAIRQGDCVQRDAARIVAGDGDVAVVEQRITRLPEVVDQVEILPIPAELVPAKPLTFVIGVMRWARHRELAEAFVEFITSADGQAHFAAAGFIPAISEEGQQLVERHGVHDA
jgi:molybdate transport system substrate-binding protein